MQCAHYSVVWRHPRVLQLDKGISKINLAVNNYHPDMSITNITSLLEHSGTHYIFAAFIASSLNQMDLLVLFNFFVILRPFDFMLNLFLLANHISIFAIQFANLHIPRIWVGGSLDMKY